MDFNKSILGVKNKKAISQLSSKHTNKSQSLKVKLVSPWFTQHKKARSEVKTWLQILPRMTHKPEENPAHSSGSVLTQQLLNY